MLNPKEIEEIIDLINKGYDLELIALELELDLEELEKYRIQLQLRKFVKDSIKKGQIAIAVEKLSSFIKKSNNNIVERFMLLKLNSYINKTNIDEQELQIIEDERKGLGFDKSIDDILEELGIQIPKRKSSNIRKKEKKDSREEKDTYVSVDEELDENEEAERPDYEQTIKKYKAQIAAQPNKSVNKRNLLAFAYFRVGMIDEARNELISLIEEYSSYYAYRQIVHLEKNEGNLEDAKLWAYDCLDRFPDNIGIREQLISIAKKENNNKEVIRLLKEIIELNPGNDKNQEKLKKAIVYEK